MPPEVENSHVSEPRLVVDPPEAVLRQRRARRADRPQRAQVAAVPRLDAGLHARRDERSAGPERGHLGVGRQLPQGAQVRVARVAVVEHDRRVGQQHPDHEVPHHPAGRREPEHAVAGLGVDVEVGHLHLLEQDPALAVDDRLGQPGRARAVEHPDRVPERHLGELELGAGPEEPIRPARARQIAERHHALERRDRPGDLLDDLAAVEVAAPVAVAVDRQQHLRLDLGKAVDHAPGAELGRRRGPDRPERRAGEHRGHGLGDVRHVRRHAVALGDAQCAQPRRNRRRLRAQLAPCPRRQRPQLGGVLDRQPVVGLVCEHVLGVVDQRTREPLRAGHRAAAEHARRRASEPQIEVLDDRGPERVDVLHRPAPQVLVALEPQSVRLLHPAPDSASASRAAPARATASREPRGLSSPRVFRSSLARRMLGMSSTKQQTAPAGQRRRARRHHAPRPGRPRDPARRPVARPPGGAGLATPLRLNLLQGPRGAVASRPRAVRSGGRQPGADRPADPAPRGALSPPPGDRADRARRRAPRQLQGRRREGGHARRAARP